MFLQPNSLFFARLKANRFLRILSYFWPVVLEKYSTSYNPVLQVSLTAGRLVLDSKYANYSFGVLHEVMNEALLHAAVKHKCSFDAVLMLGYGGGSAAQIVHEKWNSNATITAVEIDPKVIELARKHFYSDRVELVCENAAVFLRNTERKFDLIICDVFNDMETPAFSIQKNFYDAAHRALKPGALFVQNTMFKGDDWKKTEEVFKASWQRMDIVRKMSYNYLFFGHSKD